MKRFSSIAVFVFLAGITSLFLSSCTEERREAETMVPLRLSMAIPALSDSLSTRAETLAFPFKMALSTTAGEYDGVAKDYKACPIDGGFNMNLIPATANDELMVSRLATTTPLTLYGTCILIDIVYPFFYSGSVSMNEGVISSIQVKTGNAVIFVNPGTTLREYKVQLTSLYSPAMTADGQCVWNTTGGVPVLKAGNNLPDEFDATSYDSMDGYLLHAFGNMYASIAPGSVRKDDAIMTITEYDRYSPSQERGESYTVYAPKDIEFEANKCYFITLNIDEKYGVRVSNIKITPMSEEAVEIRGTPGIYDLKDLKDFRDAWNTSGSAGIESGTYVKWLDKSTNTVKMYADIDLNNEEWTPIGNTYQTMFTNITFDGNGHTVSNLKVTGQLCGFFSFVQGTTIQNLTVKNATITASGSSSTAGTIAYIIIGGKISNCHVTGKSDLYGYYAGGVSALSVNSSQIEFCTVSGATIQGYYAGGITTAQQAPSGEKITGCIVSDCVVGGNGCEEAAGIASGDELGARACVAYNVQLISSNRTYIIMESHNEIIGCFYTNITDTENGIIGVDGTGYLVTPTDLKTKYVNGNLNNTLSENSSSFNCHFENMEIKEGSPTHTDFEVGIYTATQLVDFANDFNNYDYTGYSEYLVQARLYLRDDIDMKNVDYTPIGGNNNFGHPLDGNNHKISNLSDCSSFLGKTSGSPRATVENLILENPEFTGDNCGLIGEHTFGPLSITNCRILGGTMNATQKAGGLVGSISSTGDIQINKCLVSGLSTISGTTAGGLVGEVVLSTTNGALNIQNSAVRNIGTINAGDTYPGGLIGKFQQEAGTSSVLNSCILQGIAWGTGTPGYIAGQYAISISPNAIIASDIKNAGQGTAIGGAAISATNCKTVGTYTNTEIGLLNGTSGSDNLWKLDIINGVAYPTYTGWEQGY